MQPLSATLPCRRCPSHKRHRPLALPLPALSTLAVRSHAKNQLQFPSPRDSYWSRVASDPSSRAVSSLLPWLCTRASGYVAVCPTTAKVLGLRQMRGSETAERLCSCFSLRTATARAPPELRRLTASPGCWRGNTPCSPLCLHWPADSPFLPPSTEETRSTYVRGEDARAQQMCLQGDEGTCCVASKAEDHPWAKKPEKS